MIVQSQNVRTIRTFGFIRCTFCIGRFAHPLPKKISAATIVIRSCTPANSTTAGHDLDHHSHQQRSVKSNEEEEEEEEVAAVAAASGAGKALAKRHHSSGGGKTASDRDSELRRKRTPSPAAAAAGTASTSHQQMQLEIVDASGDIENSEQLPSVIKVGGAAAAEGEPPPFLPPLKERELAEMTTSQLLNYRLRRGKSESPLAHSRLTPAIGAATSSRRSSAAETVDTNKSIPSSGGGGRSGGGEGGVGGGGSGPASGVGSSCLGGAGSSSWAAGLATAGGGTGVSGSDFRRSSLRLLPTTDSVMREIDSRRRFSGSSVRDRLFKRL